MNRKKFFPRPRRAAVQVTSLGSSNLFRNALNGLVEEEVISQQIDETADRARFEAQQQVISCAWDDITALVDAHTQAGPARRILPALHSQYAHK